jgi:flagellar export protein FliJ
MKRFKWPLQRLLDVTSQRELALRAELFALSRDIARLRQHIVTLRAVLRALLADLGRQALEQRIPQQELFMRSAVTDEKRIARLRKELDDKEKLRADKTRQFLKVKASRETLERLREEARLRHRKEMESAELKQLDESSQVSFVRRTLAAQAKAVG